MALRDLTARFLRRRMSNVVWHAAQRLAYPADFTAEDVELCRTVQAMTMTSPERIVGLAEAVRHVTRNRIDGAFVECGVWRGGSMMAAAITLRRLGDASRDLFLFDTFAGMPMPSSRDSTGNGEAAAASMHDGWCAAGEAEVRENLAATGYPMGRVHLVKGKVEQTIPEHAPDRIALLRLDTDWYESTAHELKHLYPRLSSGGVLIVDDYGHWQGAREAVEAYFATLSPRPMLARLDYTARCCVKP
ncbi:MAG TPA: TylF/MycF/NovP-related O-methyltransferase [Myxococcales bacterium]|nr:TylF/MycF/NovP-related O-methyltransferase [Myxococcales bacterium]